jgi:hypothetical protein
MDVDDDNSVHVQANPARATRPEPRPTEVERHILGRLDELAHAFAELRSTSQATAQAAAAAQMAAERRTTPAVAPTVLTARRAEGTHTPNTGEEAPPRAERQYLPKIDLFEGDKPEKAAAFLNLLRVYYLMNPRAYPTDRARSLFLIVHLRGPAEVWSRRYTETEGDHSLVLDNYTAFIAEFNNAFGMHTREDTARNTFMNMFMKYAPNEPKQYDTFREYDTAFEELRGQIGDVFGDGGIKYLYLRGLARKIQEPFVHREVDTMTFEEVR